MLSIRVITTLITLALMSAVPVPALAGENQVLVRGVELPAEDLEAAERLYVKGLGFEVVERDANGAWSLLRNSPALLLLRQVSSIPEGKAEPYLNLRVADLTAAGRDTEDAGAVIVYPEPQPNAIGSALIIADGSGNPMNLMRITGDTIGADSPPLFFNVGIRVADMEASEAFFSGLGLTVRTRDYLPQTLVWDYHGAVSLVVHLSSGQPLSGPSRGILLAAAPDPHQHLQRLRQKGWQVRPREAAAPLPESWLAESPSGVRVRLTGELRYE